MNMIKIPASWGVKREPRTPVAQRKEIITLGKSYDELFDWDILFSEAIQIGGGRIILVGPPLYELHRLIKFSDGEKELQHTSLDLTNVTVTMVESDSDTIYLEHPTERVEIPVGEICHDFEGEGCIATMQKDEPMHWIKDWVQYYHIEHGVKGFVIYDNNSETYTVEELQAELDAMPYDIKVHVVDWSMPFGPHTPTWDSNFSQFTSFEHFKYKYAWCASYAINHDIDEFLVIKEGGIPELLQQLQYRGLSALIYRTRNIDPYHEELDTSAHLLPVEERRYKDYYHYSAYNNTNNTKVGKRLIEKWLLIPEQSMEFQWRVHDFNGNAKVGRVTPDSGIYFAHFYAMQSKHKDKHPSFHNRNQLLVDKDDIMVDEVLRDKMRKVYG